MWHLGAVIYFVAGSQPLRAEGDAERHAPDGDVSCRVAGIKGVRNRNSQ